MKNLDIETLNTKTILHVVQVGGRLSNDGFFLIAVFPPLTGCQYDCQFVEQTDSGISDHWRMVWVRLTCD